MVVSIEIDMKMSETAIGENRGREMKMKDQMKGELIAYSFTEKPEKDKEIQVKNS